MAASGVRIGTLAAGICLGILTAIKPNVGLGLLLLGRSGRLKLILPACVTTAVLSIIPILLYGPAVYSEWLQAAGIDSHSIFPLMYPSQATSRGLEVGPRGPLSASLCSFCSSASFEQVDHRSTRQAGLRCVRLYSALRWGWLEYVLLLTPLFS